MLKRYPICRWLLTEARRASVPFLLALLAIGTAYAGPANQPELREKPVPVTTGASAARNADREVTGKVTDETGEGLPGVNIIVKGTSRGTSTDLNGGFSISVVDDNSVLVVSFVGYTNQEIVIRKQVEPEHIASA